MHQAWGTIFDLIFRPDSVNLFRGVGFKALKLLRGQEAVGDDGGNQMILFMSNMVVSDGTAVP